MTPPLDLREFGQLEARVEAQGREIGELKASISLMSANFGYATPVQTRPSRWAK